MRSAVMSIVALALAGCGTVDRSVLQSEDSLMHLIYMLCLLAFLMFGVGRIGSFGETLRNAAIFLTLLLGLVLAYSYRSEFKQTYQRLRAELLPSYPVADGAGAVTLTRAANGHFSTLALVNGRPTVFLIDTGATSVVLPFAEAIRLGFNSGDLVFNRRVETANGSAFEAPVLIDTLEIEGIRLNNVSAAVSEPGKLEKPLLGMSFLNRLSRYSFEGSKLTLTQ